MSDLKKIQSEIQELKEAVHSQSSEWKKERTVGEKQKRQFDSTQRGLRKEEAEHLQQAFKQTHEIQNEKIQTAKKNSQQKKNQLENRLRDILKSLDPTKTMESLEDDIPVLLLPLRLEIRFHKKESSHELWIRAYPDDIHVVHKEEILSESELKNTRQFWCEFWKAGGTEAMERGAWSSLVNSHGSGRSAYLITQFQPTANTPVKGSEDEIFLIIDSTEVLTALEQPIVYTFWKEYWLAKNQAAVSEQLLNKLQQDLGASRAETILKNTVPFNWNDTVPENTSPANVFIHPISFPDYVAKNSSWSEAPKASLLPDKLVAVLKKNGNEKTVLFPFGISKELHTGPDPSLSADEQIKKDAAGDLIINEDLKWMTDFDVAIANGMGIRIPLSAQEYQTGFDTLKVVGIRFTSDAMQSKAELESTLQAHLQSHIGAGLIRQGTPTNNTESEASGYTWLDDPDESYSRLFKSSEAFPEEEEYALQSDGQKLAEALGIDSDLVRTMPNAHHFDQLESFAMNSALFPATLGYFMEEMMDPMFSDATIRQCKTFFTHFVSGRGPVPAIRIGRQPYGILPVSIYSSLHFNEESTRFTAMKGTSFRSQLYTVLKKMDEEWSNQVNKVAHIGQSGDPHQVLLNIIGLHAHSAEFHQRYAQTLKQLYNKLALEAGPIFGALIAAAFAQRGKTILKDLGLDENLKLPVLEKFFFGKANPLQGPLIDDVPDSETNPIRDYSASGKNYIEWLASESANTIRVENFGGNEAPVALLYILLRHALLLSQSDAATRLLISSELVRDKQAFFDPDFLHVEEQEKGKSKFEHLYSVQPAISGNKLMAEHIYEPAVLALRKETIRLNETLEALNILKNIPTARLERLLTEHIDCCSYRLDAWFTALVQSKLADMRKGADKKSKQGIYIGAYGWLQQVKPENKNLQPVNLQGSLQDVFHPDTSDPLMKDANNLGYIHAPSLNQAATAAILRNAFDSNKGSGAQNPFAINLTSDRVRIAEQFLEGIRNGQPLAALLGYHFERGLHDHHQLGPGEVDKFIYPLRKVFPLVLKKLEDSKTPAEESVEYLDAQNVVDGLKLIQHIQEHPGSTYPFGFPATALPPATATEANAINKQVKVIIDIHDAIGDLVLSEQVYQTVLGNFERASGNADAFSKGNYPPEIEISHTPRSGITLTHRMAIHLDPLATAPVGSAPRVTGEPAFFQWLTQLLPPPQKIACVVSYQSPVLAATTRLVTQSDLNLHAADLFQWLQPHSEQGMNEIDDRIYHYIRYTHCDHPDLQVSIRYTEIPDPADRSIVSFFELSALLQAVKKIGKGDRYLKPEHFSLAQAGEQVKGTWDIAQLTNRLQEVKAQLNIRTTELHTLLQSIQSIQSLQNDFRAELTPHVTDPSLLESIVLQTEKDIRQLLRQPDALAINACCDQLDETLSPVVNAATRSILKTFYSNVLQAYITDFSLFDTQLKDGSSLCQALHLFRDFQCGSGVWFQDIRAVYERVRTSCEILIGRWEEKMNSYDVQIALFNPAGDPTLQFALLQKAEAEISVEVHTELPPDLQVFKNTILDLQRTNFENKLNQIRSIKTAPQNTVLAFMQNADTILQDLNIYDAVPFDTDQQCNSLYAQRLAISTLKESMYTTLQSLYEQLNEAILSFDALLAEADLQSDSNAKIPVLLKAAKKLLGEDAVLIPRFQSDTPFKNEFQKSYDAAVNQDLLSFSKNTGSSLLPVEDWLSGVARVNTKVHNWESLSIYSNAFSSGIAPGLLPLQFPYQDNDRWLALPFKNPDDPNDTFSIQGDKLLYTSHFAKPFQISDSFCGIIIDDWTEVIPQADETTGIAFHYDQPNSEPAQSILLAVPAQQKGHWSWNDLMKTIDETFEQVKKRAVEPQHLEGSNYAQFLPAVLMAVTKNWITVSANLAMNNSIYKQIKNS